MTKKFEATIPGLFDRTYTVELVKGEYISVSLNGGPKATFQIGDKAEYDSYNLSYFGVITSITEKTVTVKDGSTTKRLKLGDFCWRNAGTTTVAQKLARNAEMMNCI